MYGLCPGIYQLKCLISGNVILSPKVKLSCELGTLDPVI